MNRPLQDLTRRDFLKTASAATLAVLAAKRAYSLTDVAKTLAMPKSTADTVIVLWMGGGMAHTETFDPKAYRPFEAGMAPDSFLSTFPSITLSFPLAWKKSRA